MAYRFVRHYSTFSRRAPTQCKPRTARSSYPSKHDTSKQCWFSVGPASQTMGQHCSNIVSMCRICSSMSPVQRGFRSKLVFNLCKVVCFRSFPAKTKHLYNIYTTSAQRLRPTLYKCYTNVLCLLGWWIQELWNFVFCKKSKCFHVWN